MDMADQADATAPCKPSTADHLCVLIHGLWGNPSHLDYLATQLQKTFAEDQLEVLLTKSNANSFTYDGIELGGERTADEIERHLETLEAKGSRINKISIVGYSLGGLVARYTIGLLYSRGLFDRIKPMNFTTFATPHLGVRTPRTGLTSYLFNVMGARTLSTSGRQLFLVDSFRDTGRPLLSIMADPNSVFIRGLAKFESKTLYCNIVNDRSVAYYTSAISSKDPYVDLHAIELQPLPDTEEVLLRPDEPVKPKHVTTSSALQRIKILGKTALSTIPLALVFTVVLPIGGLLFLVNSGYQTFRSARRVKLHEAGQAGIGIDRYRMPLIEEARSLADRAYEHLSHHQGEEFLANETKVPNVSDGDASSTTSKSVSFSGQDAFPTLALTPEQFEMIESLDSLGFRKFPVHIHKVRHSHAAIIVRIQWRKGFSEGKIVVKHWLSTFKI